VRLAKQPTPEQLHKVIDYLLSNSENVGKKFAEEAKINIRNARRDANKVVETEQKGGLMTEDEAEKAKEQVQDLLKQYETKIDEIIEKKRAEIMQV